MAKVLFLALPSTVPSYHLSEICLVSPHDGGREYRFSSADGKNAAGLSNDVGAGNPNAAALPFINPELKQLAAIFPEQKVLATLETLVATNIKVRRLKNKLWTEMKLK